MRIVTATEAGRHFYRVLSHIRAGESVIVTLRGKPVARIDPPPRGEVRDHGTSDPESRSRP